MARWTRLFAVALSSGWIAAAGAQELKIGLSAEPSSIDPHFHNLTPNNSMMRHIFDTLLEQDEQQRIKPRLAVSWRTVNDTTWEFKLRPGVKFTDGSDFTANDVIYSFCRVPQIENSPSSLAINVRAITGMTAPDPLTLLVTTAQAHPLLPSEMSTIAILSAKANGAGAVTFDRQACKGVGTYPKTEAFNCRRGGDRHRAVQARPLHQGRPHHPGAQRGLSGARSRPGSAPSSGRSPAPGRASPRCSPATST